MNLELITPHRYPAYTILQLADEISDQVDLQDDHVIAIPYESRNHGTLYNFYCLGIVTDPAELQLCKDLGHDTHYAFNTGVTLTATKQDHKYYFGFRLGQTISLGGERFIIEPTNNEQIKLKRV